jgi:hypothetical protein
MRGLDPAHSNTNQKDILRSFQLDNRALCLDARVKHARDGHDLG